jgi:hypothetical protein
MNPKKDQKDFETLCHLEAFLIEGAEQDVANMSDEELDKEVKLAGIDTGSMLTRVKDAVARAQDQKRRSKARAKSDMVREIAKNIQGTLSGTLEDFKKRWQAACEQDQTLALQFRDFSSLESPEELERAWAILEKVEQMNQQDKDDERE